MTDNCSDILPFLQYPNFTATKMYVVFYFVRLQVKGIEKFRKSVCDMAISFGCRDLGKKAFKDRNEDNK